MKFRLLMLVIGVLVTAIVVILALPSEKKWTSVERVVLADPRLITSSLVYVALDQGFFAAEGIDLILTPVTSGKASIAMVTAGAADLANAADVPLVRAILEGKPLKVLATIQTTEKDIAITARKDAGITTPADLAGKRLGVIPGTNTSYFANLFLAVEGLARDAITFVPVEVDTALKALVSGQIDALSSWTMVRFDIDKALGDRTVTFSGEGIYTVSWTLVAMDEFAKQRPATVRGVLRALVRAEAFVAANRTMAIDIAARHLGLNRSLIASQWDNFGFRVALDQALLVNLEGVARSELLSRPGVVAPNFLDVLDPDGLAAVVPSRITTLH
ncbi:NitT/TauT family transport system substrate-binding protein [uncultured Gammaproteobacteria bacterium]